MAYKKSGFNLHQFVTALVVVFAIVGIALTVFASQQRTQTEGEASECRGKPRLDLVNTRGFDNYVNYRLDAKNTNPLSCKGHQRYGLRIQDQPSLNWKFQLTHLDGDTNPVTDLTPYRVGTNYIEYPYYVSIIFSQEIDKYRLKVTPPANARSQTYWFIIQVCKKINEVDGDGLINCADRNLSYTVD